MGINEAIALRMQQLAHERYVTLNEIIKRGKLNQSTISEIMRAKSKHPRVSTIEKFCKGCNIKMTEFFDSPLFDELTEDEPAEKKTDQSVNFADDDIPFAAKMPLNRK